MSETPEVDTTAECPNCSSCDGMRVTLPDCPVHGVPVQTPPSETEIIQTALQFEFFLAACRKISAPLVPVEGEEADFDPIKQASFDTLCFVALLSCAEELP